MAWTIDTAIEKAEQFTQAYQKAELDHPAKREAACLRAMYPSYLAEILDGDGFAGRAEAGIAGYRFSCINGEIGYYFKTGTVYAWRRDGLLSAAQEERIRSLEDYWESRATIRRYQALDAEELPEEARNALFVDRDDLDWTQAKFSACYMPRLCEINLNFDKLLTVGLPGLLAEVRQCREKAAGDAAVLYESMESALGLLKDVCLYYAGMAEKQAEEAGPSRRDQLFLIAETLRNIAERPPETLREAIQLFWLYGLLASLDNFGRMDVYLGNFLARDMDSGRLDERQALELLLALWRLILSSCPGSGRVIIGGMGRRNEANANRFALLAMEATATMQVGVSHFSPQLSLRLHAGQDKALYEKALDVLAMGRTYPMLYNDDVNVPAVCRAFRCSPEDAEQYIMSNCGEYDIEHRSVSSPNGSINYARVAELALFDGVDPASGIIMGPRTGRMDQFRDFGGLWAAFEAQVRFILSHTSNRMAKIHEATMADSPNLFCSMLFDDCLETGKGLVEGARYLGFDIETHGIVSAADCLAAVRRVVFETGQIPAGNLLKMIQSNYEGYERERRLLLDAPKYGNDDAEADGMVLRVYDFVNEETTKLAEKHGVHFSLATHIGVNANVYLGGNTAATADGRKAGEPLSNSLNPLAGRDRNGFTALLNSMAKFNPHSVAGQVMHLKLGRQMFGKHRGALESMLDTYFKKGGSYLCLAVMDRGELENALEKPDEYANLMVRVGGFSARFVSLPREMQLEILSRTLY